MRILAAAALLLLLGAQANAQTSAQPAPPRKPSIRFELLELEQEVDKSVLREAMLQLGRKAMKPAPAAEAEKADQAAEVAALRGCIDEKKRAIIERSDELKAMQAESNRVRATTSAPANPNTLTQADRQALIEKVETAQIELQLLQKQVQLFGQPLNEAVDTLANAEVAASNDESQRGKAEAARKQYEKAKAKYVEVSKKFQEEQDRMNGMQLKLNMGGMAGMGGMGGGFR
jgi:hypothetical protein